MEIVNLIKTSLRIKCSNCGHWNSVPVNKIFIEQPSPEPKVKAYIPMYESLEISRCEKYGKVIAEPKELIRIVGIKSLFCFLSHNICHKLCP